MTTLTEKIPLATLFINAPIVVLPYILRSVDAREPGDVLPKSAFGAETGVPVPVLPPLTKTYVPIGAPLDDSFVVTLLAVATLHISA